MVESNVVELVESYVVVVVVWVIELSIVVWVVEIAVAVVWVVELVVEVCKSHLIAVFDVFFVLSENEQGTIVFTLIYSII